MALEITFLGHAGFLLSDGEQTVAVDPFLSGNPVATMSPDQVRCGHVVVTHGHEDHFADTVSIAKANDATVYGAFELTTYCQQQGVEQVQPANPGGKIETDFGYVAFTQAFHSSSFKGQYMGMPCGAVVRMGGVTFYHCGDTALFSDMKLIGRLHEVDVAAVPIGDRFTMDGRQGAMAAEFIGPKVAIPIHFKTWPLLAQDTGGFEPEGVEVKELEPGETWSFGG